MFVYRKLKVEEAKDFWDLMNQMDDETKYMLYEPGERKEKFDNLAFVEHLISESLEEKNFLLVAEENQKLLGYILAQRTNLNRIRHTAYIVVGLLQHYTNKGIGTEFFQQLEVWAREKKVVRLELTVVCENEIAKRLYEKSGFEIEGIKKSSIFAYGKFLDEYYMAKIIPAK